MSRIRSKNTRPELDLRKALWRAGYRYRVSSDLPGHPDLIFPKTRLAVFVDGCFWHGCPIHYSAPSNRFDFWAQKLRRNVDRDLEVDSLLRDLGWLPIRIWQHELKCTQDTVHRLSGLLKSQALGQDGTEEQRPPTAREDVSNTPWYRCFCGNKSVRVIAVSEPGSLRPNAIRRPASVQCVCPLCKKIFSRMP